LDAERTPKRFRLGGLALLAPLAALALLAPLALPGAAPAQRGLLTGLTGPGQYQGGDPATRALWFDRTVDAGAGIVRLAVEWRDVAQRPANPTNPASYNNNLSSLDGGVRDAAARGVQALISVNTAPAWADGPGRPASLPETASWKPSPSDLADFMQALAARYSGGFDPDGGGPQPPLPAAQALQVLNEPNQDAWLAPQFDGRAIIGPDQYRALLNASYRAIKAVNPGMLVVTGGTSPYGDPPGGPYPPGGARVRPVQWWENFLCVHPVTVGASLKKLKKALRRARKAGNRAKIKKLQKRLKEAKKKTTVSFARTEGCAGPALFDVLAHQAIDNTGGGPLRSGPDPDDASTPDLGRIVGVLRAAESLGTLPGAHPAWVTEFWWDSNPPNPVGAPLDVQAAWIEQSLYLFWKAGASAAINFEIQDSTLYPVTRNGYQSGLYSLGGSPKPALTAFRFPFVTERINKRAVRAWGRAPLGGTLSIQRQQGADWVTIKELQVSKGAVFLTELRSSGKKRKKGKKRRRPFPASALRATVGASQSLAWYQS
jgi:hypothetical protein